MSFLLVGIGAASGALLRYLVSRLVHLFYKGSFPLATFLVNMVGSYMMALYLITKPSETVSLVMLVGFLGGLTTFSTFAVEGVQLLKKKEVFTFIYYIGMSYVLGILLASLRYVL
ncbi:fluoride efflux transporter FluC [Brochothrix campestris]|uniref:Fluoride-specific ion channel FluC n=1 Tax=Brochothrix campestris FSL F6-1037 TaxID=1265861 RepID=W7CTY3_9LIST|nr:CrcB family protein [Brochothrix campestris]EUJ40170.1 CrcB protein [Brochothrix campestris FSL F6-1037]